MTRISHSVVPDENDDPPKLDRGPKRFKFYVRKAKLPNREDLSFHSCRHTTGSWLSDAGRAAVSSNPFCSGVILSGALGANATEYSWGAKRIPTAVGTL